MINRNANGINDFALLLLATNKVIALGKQCEGAADSIECRVEGKCGNYTEVPFSFVGETVQGKEKAISFERLGRCIADIAVLRLSQSTELQDWKELVSADDASDETKTEFSRLLAEYDAISNLYDGYQNAIVQISRYLLLDVEAKADKNIEKAIKTRADANEYSALYGGRVSKAYRK